MEKLTIEVQQILKSGDSFQAIERIQQEGSREEIAARYKSLVLDLYWKARDLPAVITVGRAGVIYCLTQSLRSDAKALAYNVGSFTWPGWEEAGICPTADDLAVGRECAQLNLRLAIELKKPTDRISMAHWLLGAHALAVKDFARAEEQFQNALDVIPAGDPAGKALEPCNLGYLMIARLGNNPSDAGSRAKFDEIIAGLKARSDNDAKSYLAQLLAAAHFK